MEPPFSHPGSPPPRPEVPDRLPLAWSTPPPTPAPSPDETELPAWPPWAPLAGMAMTFVAALIGFLVIGVAIGLGGGDVDEDNPALNIGGTVVQDLALIASAVILARLLTPSRARARDFGIRRTRFWPSVGWLVVAWLGFFAFAFVWGLIVGPEEQDDLPAELGANESTLALVCVTVLVTVLAPIGEEFFFRGFFFPAMRRWIGLIPGAALTGIVFGAIHAGGTPVELLVVLAVFGFLLCLLYVWTKSLLPCMVLHALNNSLALGVNQEWTWEIPLLMAGATLAILAIMLPLARRSREPAPPALP